jgi:hypothetical protein
MNFSKNIDIEYEKKFFWGRAIDPRTLQTAACPPQLLYECRKNYSVKKSR